MEINTRNALVFTCPDFVTITRSSQKTRNIFSVGEVVIFTFVTGMFIFVQSFTANDFFTCFLSLVQKVGVLAFLAVVFTMAGSLAM